MSTLGFASEVETKIIIKYVCSESKRGLKQNVKTKNSTAFAVPDTAEVNRQPA